MVKLRLTRRGKKKQPFYRIVAMDVTAARESQFLDQIGTYDPLHARVAIDEEAALLWLNHGAQMSDTVASLLRSQGILARWKGQEGTVREDALKRDKPARRRKLALTAPVEETAEEPQETAEEPVPQEPEAKPQPETKETQE